MVFATVILAGVFQILFGVLGFGQYIRLVPYPVVSGFMSGIGCIIIALQLARLFGHEPEGGGTIPALLEVPAAMADPNYSALGDWPTDTGHCVCLACSVGQVPSQSAGCTDHGDFGGHGIGQRTHIGEHSDRPAIFHHALCFRRYLLDYDGGRSHPRHIGCY